MMNSVKKKKRLTTRKKKLKSIGSLKKKVWKEFSKYIRTRDCIRTTGTLNYGICVTCHGRFGFGELQAGHLLDGRTGKNLFEERGVFAQCSVCNMWKHGNKEVYIPWFIEKYGMEEYEELCQQKRQPYIYSRVELNTKLEEYKEKTRLLEERLYAKS